MKRGNMHKLPKENRQTMPWVNLTVLSLELGDLIVIGGFIATWVMLILTRGK